LAEWQPVFRLTPQYRNTVAKISVEASQVAKEAAMQDLEVRVVALGKKMRSVAIEYGFDLNEAGLIVHEACLYILRDLPDAAQPIANVEDADHQVEASAPLSPAAWRGRA
jgi:hypothetical protein